VKKLAIKDVSEQTGVAAGTIRMWEQRYGFPTPARTPAGYRVYSEQDVIAIRRVVAYRDRGLSVPAALDRARSLEGPTDRPSIFAALGESAIRPQRLRKPTLVAISRAIEEEAIARAAGPVIIASFQAESNYRAVEHRYRRLAHVADAVGVFAAFGEKKIGSDDEPAEIPVTPADSLGHEWAVIVDAPGYAACLVGWETPEPGRVFEAIWTLDPTVVRRAAQVGAALAARAAPDWSERLLGLLADRPLAVEQPAPGLTALTNRMISYLDAEGDRPRA
jgi:DICT domain-containing protein